MDLNRGSAYGYDQRVEIMGSRGMLQIGNQSGTSLTTATSSGISGDTLLPSFPERFERAYLAELGHLVDVLEGETEPLVTRRAAVMATVVAEACRVSAESGKQVLIEGDEYNYKLVTA